MKRFGKCSMCIVLCLAAFAVRPTRAGQFVAYSLAEAERRLKSGAAEPELSGLAGITRFVGVVHDRVRNDLLVVGQAVPGEAAVTLDDMVVALRARLVHTTWPLVSIDRTPETAQTRRQKVRFEGGVENTKFGEDFLKADAFLKNLALGKMSAEIWGIRSYFDMAVERARQDAGERTVSTRFWFFPLTTSVPVREDIAAVRELSIGVRKDVFQASSGGKEIEDVAKITNRAADVFADSVTKGYEDLAASHPEVRRVETLLQLVAIAYGVEELKDKPDLTFWLREYRVAEVPTQADYPLLKSESPIQSAGREWTLEVNGGAELRIFRERLEEDGDITAIRDVVLRSRPEGNVLSWRLPFDGWPIPRCQQGPGREVGKAPVLPVAQGRQLGCNVNERIFPAGMTAVQEPLAAAWQPINSRLMAPDIRVADSFARVRMSNEVGGVMLSGAAQIAGMGQGAKVDLSGGNFSLVVDGKDARIAPEAYRKFITALWCVYYSDQEPGISIDPPKRDRNAEESVEELMKPEKHSVRYIGRVFNTDLGRVMREADYVMKKWAVGSESSDYPGLLSVDGYTSGSDGITRFSQRFWFVPEDLSFKRGGDLLLFASGRMRVNTEYLGGSAQVTKNPAAEAFADFFTQHYEKIAHKHPIFQELFEYAKLVSLARYLKQQGVPLHWFLLAHKDLVLMEDSVREVDALVKRSEQVAGQVVKVHVAKGGVNLAATPTYHDDPGTADAVANVLAAFPSVPIRTTGLPGRSELRRAAVPVSPFSFNVGSRAYSVLPQHTMTSGKDHRGIRYQTDLALRHGARPGLELVRYYDPRNREGGDFGHGWRLLIPYRVKPADKAKTEFLTAMVPQRMEVENLCTGEREVLGFDTKRREGAGYVSDRPKSSQVVALLLKSNASYCLVDKLGNQFHFDPSGYMTDMFLSSHPSDHVHIDYADAFTNGFERAPYEVRPAGEERVRFLNAMVPKEVKVVDLLHGTEEVLTFDAQNRIPGYVPRGGEASRVRLLAVLSNAGLQMIDKHGNEVVFTPGWKFSKMLPSRDQRIVRGVAMGGHKARFHYTIDASGRVMIASARLSEDRPDASATHVVRYEHDSEGRLCRVQHSDAAASRSLSQEDRDPATAADPHAPRSDRLALRAN